MRASIELVQLKNGLDITVRFTRTGLHFNVKVYPALCAGNQGVRQRKVLPLLNFTKVLFQLRIGQKDIGILKPSEFQGHRGLARVDGIGVVLRATLPGKTVNNRVNRVGLIGLNFKLEFHLARHIHINTSRETLITVVGRSFYDR